MSEPLIPGDLTPEERSILSRSHEYRNSRALANAMKVIRDEHGAKLSDHDNSITAMQMKVSELETKLTSMTALVMSLLGSGPTTR